MIEGNSEPYILEENSMLKNFTILIFVFIAAVADVKAQKSSDKTADTAAIRAAVEQMAKGWNTKSGAEFAKPFAEDADYVIVNGTQIKGRAAIAKGHQEIFDTIYKNTTISLSVDSIRFLRSDVAVVHVSGTRTAPQEAGQPGAVNGKITLVMTKENGRWEIVAFQNTKVQPADETKK